MRWKLKSRTFLTWKFPNLQYLSVHLTFIFTCLFIYLSVCLSVCLSFISACLSYCLSSCTADVEEVVQTDLVSIEVWHCMTLYDAAWCCMMLYVGIYLLYAMCTHVKMPLHSLCCVSPTINIVSEPGPRKTTLNTGVVLWTLLSNQSTPWSASSQLLQHSYRRLQSSTNVTASDDCCGIRTRNGPGLLHIVHDNTSSAAMM